MTAQRILLINEDGTAEVGGVKVRVVPVEPQREMLHSADNMMDGDLAYSDLQAIYSCMLSAAAIDLSGLPRVPKRLSVEPRDTEYDEGVCAGYNAALDAIKAKHG